MVFEQIKEYLVGERIFELTCEGRLALLQKKEIEIIEHLSKKKHALRFNGFVITDEQENIVFEDRKRYVQHFFPLSVIDYVRAMYNFERHSQPIPILSIDSHDVLRCDFRCQDCLSAHGTNFPVQKFPKGNFKIDLKTYKQMLKAIVDYSEKRGFKGVRFEQSGEGNPDYYEHRGEILKYARELGMQSVYVSTGSKIDNNLRKALVENSSFIRISFPGIGEAYKHYSGQSKFTFIDALNGLGRIIDERDKQGRKRDLMIGARAALRAEHSDANFNVNVPHGLDSMVYSREIENRAEFPTQCFSARFQPVLAGRSLFVCTISDIMYSHNLRLGTFANEEGELERFLHSENIDKVTTGIPTKCNSCSNIYDNMLLFSLQKLFRTNPQKLNFYEIIK